MEDKFDGQDNVPAHPPQAIAPRWSAAARWSGPTKTKLKRLASREVCAALGIALTLPARNSALAQTYSITDLGPLGGFHSSAYGINNFGQVVGASLTGNSYRLQSCTTHCDYWPPDTQPKCEQTTVSEQHAFLWTPTVPNGTNGILTDLGALGGPDSDGRAINDPGQIVGLAADATKLMGRDCNEACCFTYEYYSNHVFLWSPSTPNSQSGSMKDLTALGFP